jgi:hypothetical protein
MDLVEVLTSSIRFKIPSNLQGWIRVQNLTLHRVHIVAVSTHPESFCLPENVLTLDPCLFNWVTSVLTPSIQLTLLLSQV